MRIHSLGSAISLNGSIGMCVGSNELSGRWGVDIEGVRKAFKECNLEVMEPDPMAPFDHLVGGLPPGFTGFIKEELEREEIALFGDRNSVL